VDRSNGRELHVYGPEQESRPVASIVLDADEADRAAEILQSRPMVDRVAEIERRVAEIAGGS
jgi:TrkA domain protein